GVGARKLQRYGEAFLEVLNGSAGGEAPRVVTDLRHELISLARAGMTPAQIASQLNVTEKNVYGLLAEAIGNQQLTLEQALDLPEELLMEVQGAFRDGEGELPAGAEVAAVVRGRVARGALHCVRAALESEFELSALHEACRRFVQKSPARFSRPGGCPAPRRWRRPASDPTADSAHRAARSCTGSGRFPLPARCLPPGRRDAGPGLPGRVPRTTGWCRLPVAGALRRGRCRGRWPG